MTSHTPCAERFPGASLLFDAVPAWLARLVRRGTPGYQPPPLPWTVDPARLAELARMAPGDRRGA